MKLITQEMVQKLPSLSDVKNFDEDELVAQVKFHIPLAGYCWYVFSADIVGANDVRFYGMVETEDGMPGEIGFFRLSELESIRINVGDTSLCVERDASFHPALLSTISDRLI